MRLQHMWLSKLKPFELAHLTLLLPVLAEGRIMAGKAHANSKSDQRCFDVINDINQKLKSMAVDQFAFIPGGW